MAQEQQVQKKDQINDTEDFEVEYLEIEPQPYGGIYNVIFKGAQFAATTFLGLFFIEKISYGLEIVEKTAKWCLPQRGTDKHIVLERPLSWLPFIWLIVFLRVIQTVLSVASVLIGNNPVQMRDIVYFLQTRRRKLRALKNQGYRSMNESQLDNSVDDDVPETSKNILNNNMSQVGACPVFKNDEPTELLTPVKCQTASLKKTDTNRKSLKRWSPEKCANETLSVDQMLDKYAALDSADDSDFLPEADLSSLNSSSANTTSSSCTDQSESKTNHSQSDAKEPISPQKSKMSDDTNCGIKENGDRVFSKPKLISNEKSEKLSNAEMGNKPHQNLSKTAHKKKAALNGSPLRDQNDKTKVSAGHESDAPKGESPNMHNTTFDFNSTSTPDSTQINKNAEQELSDIVKPQQNHLENHVNNIQMPTTTL